MAKKGSTWAKKNTPDTTVVRLSLIHIWCPHVADDAAEEQGDHAAPEGHMDAKLFAHDGQEEGASARAETADGNGQAYAGAAQFRWEQLRGIGKFRDDGGREHQGKGGDHDERDERGH